MSIKQPVEQILLCSSRAKFREVNKDEGNDFIWSALLLLSLDAKDYAAKFPKLLLSSRTPGTGGRAITRHVVTLAAYFQRIIPSCIAVVFFFWSISSLFIQRPQVILGELFDMSSKRRNAMISGGIIPSCIHLELTSPHRHSSTSHKLFGGSCARNATLPSPFTF